MARKKNVEEEILQDDRELIIKDCLIKDGKANYSFEKLVTPGKGDTEAVKGAALVEADMHKAAKRLHVHFAMIDDAFDKAGVAVTSISKVRNHELVQNYSVHGFKIKGKKDDEKVSLIGKKYVSVGGYEAIDTPDVLMAEFSAYKWWNELKSDIDNWRREVELYRNGKCIPVEDEVLENPDQTKLQFEEPVDELNGKDMVDEFKTARVK